MDPNAALKEMRAAISDLQKGITDPSVTIQVLEFIADRAEALDHWLTYGGGLPSAWADIAEPVKS